MKSPEGFAGSFAVMIMHGYFFLCIKTLYRKIEKENRENELNVLP
jgi:cbb3-type cytochrome oxidase subunit 3